MNNQEKMMGLKYIGTFTGPRYASFIHADSGIETQIKIETFANTDFFEFSCGCCFEVDNGNKLMRKSRDAFFGFYIGGLEKLHGLRPTSATKQATAKYTPLNKNCFPKTPHVCCPEDPNLMMELMKMTAQLGKKTVGRYLALCWTPPKEKRRGKEFSETFRSIQKQKITETELTMIAYKLWLPFFDKTSTIHLQKTKETNLTTTNFKEMQDDFAAKQAQALTDEELITLFSEASVKEKKPKSQQDSEPNCPSFHVNTKTSLSHKTTTTKKATTPEITNKNDHLNLRNCHRNNCSYLSSLITLPLS
ncbi:Oidioi.mRNA.OKI2018_I69.chr2.g5578.t1.cds [Oikopleura dioica]|uniref:Oidioi.mRNA.OKI2018_I69.chr2.g5578.t1.cds n=1 Tax=Oikopleura dioica TaxID=34765 RepID=A0ABN7T4C5_OIKDI|nr:Oidioi.mRNA.OKI2018_I69.chr2.g5578.t1.cds [Oikopleura dioica]